MASLLHPDLLLQAYAAGLFPMAESATAEEVFWVNPERRSILPLDTFHVPARLARSVRQGIYDISINRCFADVIAACAAVPRGEKTWINQTIRASYTKLHELGFAHSVEVWKGADEKQNPNSPPLEGGVRGGVKRKNSKNISAYDKRQPEDPTPLIPLPQGEGKKLVGGLYGISLGRAFFGESMFSTSRDASKIALVHLVTRLVQQDYMLLDAQFTNPHLLQFGAVEISREEYHSLLGSALGGEAFFGEDAGFEGERSLASAFLQSRTQMS